MRASEFTQPGAAGCIIVAEDTGRWCLQQRSDTVSDPGLWSTWGGGREPGETLEQAVRRELAEEGGYVGPLKLEPLHSNAQYATFIGRVPHEFEPEINFESKDWCWADQDQLPEPMHPGLVEALSKLDLNESRGSYKEIEFICVNPQFPDATDPELQKQMFAKLKQIPGVIPLWQEWGDYSEGQLSLSAIYKDRAARSKILSLAKQLGVEIDLEQPVSDNYVDRAIRGEHEGQIAENFADGKVKGKSRPGRVKRAGASCNGSVTDLRARAKRASGERARMYHWCANMKSGRKK
jgi:8-oxo-dGTP pyrophosphatase MutT (NUDIX family)